MTPRNLLDCLTLAHLDAGAALDTQGLVEDVLFLDVSHDRLGGATGDTGVTTVAFFRINDVLNQLSDRSPPGTHDL